MVRQVGLDPADLIASVFGAPEREQFADGELDRLIGVGPFPRLPETLVHPLFQLFRLQGTRGANGVVQKLLTQRVEWPPGLENRPHPPPVDRPCAGGETCGL